MEESSLWLKVLAVVLGLVPFAAALGYLIVFLNSKSKESKLAFVLAQLTEAAKAIVVEVEVTLKPKLIAALEDGVLTDKEKTELKSLAMKLFWEKVPSTTMKAASSIFGPMLESLLSSKVEGAVALMKQSGVADQLVPVPPKPTTPDRPSNVVPSKP